MDDFADVAGARESYKIFARAMNQGREILTRAGLAQSPPPVPDFDAVFRSLDYDARQTLYSELRSLAPCDAAAALRIWTPLLKLAFIKR